MENWKQALEQIRWRYLLTAGYLLLLTLADASNVYVHEPFMAFHMHSIAVKNYSTLWFAVFLRL